MTPNEVMLDILKVNYEDRFQAGGMKRFQKSIITVFPRLLELARSAATAQSKLDAMMLEYCPDWITNEQISEWEAQPVPAPKED